MFFTNRLLESFLLPPVGPLLLVILGLLLCIFRKRAGLVCAWLGVALSLFFVLPSSVEWIAGPLEHDSPVFDLEKAGDAQAIVILGGGRQRFAPEYDASAVNRLTLERVRYGATLARATRLPVMTAGGIASVGASEAALMAKVLLEFGIKPTWLEDMSATTADNARNAAAILQPQKITRIVLVTHAMHMRRARIYFEAQGFTVIPAPLGFIAGAPHPNNFLSWLPTSNSAYAGWYASHEWAGLLQQRFSDRAANESGFIK